MDRRPSSRRPGKPGDDSKKSSRSSGRKEDTRASSRRAESGRSAAKESGRSSGRPSSRRSEPAPSSSSGRKSSRESTTKTSKRASSRLNSVSGESTTRTSLRDRGDSTPMSPVPFIMAGVLVVLCFFTYFFYNYWCKAELFKQLRSAEAKEREIAINGLMRYGSSARDGLFSVLLNQTAPNEEAWPEASRSAAATGLVTLRLGDVDKKLGELAGANGAKDDEIKLKTWVMNAIMNGNAVERFDAMLFTSASESKVDSIRLASAKALGSFKGPSVTASLEKLVYDEDDKIRHAAVASLDKAAGVDSISLLIKLLSDSDETVATTARTTLTRLGEGSKAIEKIGDTMNGADERLALMLLEILAEHTRHKSATGQIAKAISHTSIPVRCRAIELAGRKMISATYPDLVKAAFSDNPAVRAAAVRAVGMTNNMGLSKEIEKTLEDKDPGVRVVAIDTLWKSGYHTTSVLGSFIKMLDDGEREVVEMSLKALNSIKSSHHKEFGNNTEKWKEWWVLYHKQVGVIDEMEKTLEKVRELFGKQNNESYEKAEAIIEAAMKSGEELLKRPDLVSELKDSKSSYRVKLNGLMQRLQTDLYTSKKHHTN
ncbi:MAG: HEAT repeat domain-containing protein [Planctomycetes bacterium]|nr:HEAT repeat domain-containing protein [Planctomycetota bacterium]